jgi:hypothetical protein
MRSGPCNVAMVVVYFFLQKKVKYKYSINRRSIKKQVSYEVSSISAMQPSSNHHLPVRVVYRHLF